MAKAKAAPKTEETPMVSMTVFNALLARVEALEAEKTKLVNDVSVLKKIPASLVVQETAVNRNTERIDSLAECIKNMPKPKPKKILGLF
jgi:hypothetical protein|tara:strand:+ start:181 stop:447 length:267 start_codon:yes stop_codon:yes gene_type:complete